jgi:hypothetical protein
MRHTIKASESGTQATRQAGERETREMVRTWSLDRVAPTIAAAAATPDAKLDGSRMLCFRSETGTAATRSEAPTERGHGEILFSTGVWTPPYGRSTGSGLNDLANNTSCGPKCAGLATERWIIRARMEVPEFQKKIIRSLTVVYSYKF